MMYLKSIKIFSLQQIIKSNSKDMLCNFDFTLFKLKSIIPRFRYWFPVFIIIFLSSCEKEINNPIEHFSKSQKHNLVHSKIINLEDFNVLNPGIVIKTEDSYMIWDHNNEDMFSLINFDTKKVIRGVRKGNGPGEIVSSGSLQYVDGNFYIYDVATKKISKIVVSDIGLSLGQVFEVKSDHRMFMTNYRGDNVVATGIFEDSWLRVINEEGEVVSKIDFPHFPETDNIPDVSLSTLYISTHMANSPNNKKMVSATQNHGVISFFYNREDSQLEEYKQIKYYGPTFSIHDSNNISFSRDNVVGFCGLDCDDRYVYALYSGKTFTEHGMQNHHCNNLFVYDWDGTPIKHYVLDISLYSMNYDKERNIIYGIGFNPEGVLVEYQL